MDILIQLLLIIFVFGLLSYIVNLFPIPQPYKNIALALVALICLFYIIGSVHLGHPLVIK